MEESEIKKLSELKPAAYNPRTIKPKALAGLQNSMQEFGDISGVVFNVRSGNLVGGHQRTKILNSINDGEVTKTPFFDETGTVAQGYIITQEGTRFNYREVDWDEIKERTANIEANNKHIGGEWDISGLADVLSSLDGQVDFEAFNFDELIEDLDIDMKSFDGEEEENAESEKDDVVPELEGEPIIKRGDLIELGEHRLLCGDSTSQEDVESLMAGEKADMVFTDPPYNVNYVGGTKEALTILNDCMGEAQFVDFLLGIFTNFPLKPGGYFYICAPPGDPETVFRNTIRQSGLTLKQCLVWVKSRFVMGRQDYHWRHESILCGWKPGAAHYFVNDRTQDTVWEFDKPSASRLHPTMKPLGLVERAVANSSRVGEMVFDSCSGSGSTLIACEKTKRKCYGMELDPHYCDVIIQRYIDYTGNGRIKINGVDISWEQEAGIRKLEAEEMTDGGI
jgi:DNA modification methylase